MAGLTLTDAETKLAEWLAIDSQLQNGQQVRFGDRWLTRADAEQVRLNIDYWNGKCKEAATNEGRSRARNVSPSW